ncbi:hypothetical protein PZE06_18865 [Robertmurraya sp. DFI.2.37]|uniref:hypothetical protein n=1 Tax=Robertmurraya sp. DFI.2.37 TaxID=3031819 RepID=UPI0023DB2EF0|nr:hypothetical protein [Robertmurraya sp. DFI.2.37]MDF1510200.1 hypothetical protein [Robertmurraya sp. DFI.2.37]
MQKFKKSKALEDLIKKREELQEKSIEKKRRIQELNDANQTKLSQVKQELKKAVIEYAETPSDELEEKISKLEREEVILTAKVAGSRQRETTVFQSDISELASINAQIEALAEKEYTEYYRAEEARIYKKIAELKKEYLETVKYFHDIKDSTNREYNSITRKGGIVSIYDPDFFWNRGEYRPLGITEYEVKRALSFGEVDDRREFPNKKMG